LPFDWDVKVASRAAQAPGMPKHLGLSLFNDSQS
jgi:hypothetical protein